MKAVRQPLAVRERSRRRLEERLGLRFPRLTAFLARSVWRLRPQARLRQAAVRRYIRAGFEAINRGDHEAGMLLYHPEIESTFPPELATVGGEKATHGREARLRFQEQWYADWDRWTVEPTELIDVGDRILVLAQIKGAGRQSGAAIATRIAWLYTVPDGRASREAVFFDHAEALRTAGLSE